MENKTKKTKTFKFGMTWQCYGTQTVEVPEDFTQEQAEQYVYENLMGIDLPDNGEYVDGSEEADFEDSGFSGFDKEEE